MTLEYRAVNEETRESKYWTPFLKQLHVSSGVWTLFFMNGLNSGAPTVIIPQIRKEWNTTVTVDDELASWLYSASNLSALPWIFFLPALSHFIGRKPPYLACSIAMTIIYVLLYFSTTPYQILIAEAIQGFVNGSSVTIMIHIIPEYCNHRYRSMYINIQCTSLYWGIWTSNVIGTFLPWKYIAVLGLFCTLYTFTVGFYPESPRWLASKGRFMECEAAHRWLHGSSPEAEEELRDLIKSQSDYPKENRTTCSKFMKMLTCKQFYMPLFLVILVGAQYNFSGKLVCSIYAIDILKKITKSEDAAYTDMLVLDGVTVFGMYVGSFLTKFLRLRPLFFSLLFFSIGMMFSFSVYLYLAKLEIIQGNNIVTLGLLVVYSLTVSSGPIILSLNFYSEIVSIRYQVISDVITSFFFLVSCATMLKFSPVIFSELGLHGSFLFFGITSITVATLLYIYLPETKNKTLEEIDQCFKESSGLPEAEKLTKQVEGEDRI